MPPLRLGLLGTGVAARKLYAPALAACGDEVRLVACANRTRAKALAFARAAGVPTVAADADALLRDPGVDAVLLSLPIEAQPAYVLKALRAGKAVLSEKPLAPSLAAGRRLLAAAAPLARRGLWMVAENYRFMPHLDWAEARLAEGALGDLRLVEVRQTSRLDAANPYYHTAWRRDARFVGGFVLDAGVHLAHVLRRLLGAPAEIRGLTARFNPELRPLDTAVAALRFRGGAVGTWLSCFSQAAGGPLLALRGTRATLEIHWDRAALKPVRGRERVHRAAADSYALQFRHFARAARGRTPCVYTPGDALADLAVMEGVVRGRVLKP